MQEKTQKQRTYNPKTDIIFGPSSRYQGDDTAIVGFRNDLAKIHQKFAMQSYYDVSDGKTTDTMAQGAFNHFNKNNMGFFIENQSTQELEMMSDEKATKYLQRTLDYFHTRAEQKYLSTPNTGGTLEPNQKKRATQSELQQDDSKQSKRRKTKDDGDSKHASLPPSYFASEQHTYNPDTDIILGSSKHTCANTKGNKTFSQAVGKAIYASKSQEITESQLQKSFDQLKQSGMRFFTDNNDKTDLAELSDKVAKNQLKVIIEKQKKRMAKDFEPLPLTNQQTQGRYVLSSDKQVNLGITEWANDVEEKRAAIPKPPAPIKPMEFSPIIRESSDDSAIGIFNKMLKEQGEPQFSPQPLQTERKPQSHAQKLSSKKQTECRQRNPEDFRHNLKSDDKQKGFH